MMIMRKEALHPNPTVQIPPWDDPMDHIHLPFSVNTPNELQMAAYDNVGEYDDVPLDASALEHFHMYEFKVKRCAREPSHDWIDCPYAHPGEKARRRDPRKFRYSGDQCPEYRKRTCGKGDTCEFAHGVFECWLHPSRYRTQPCKDGVKCHRRICFFAHTPEQLRVLPVSHPGGSPSRFLIDSPPISPVGQSSVNELTSYYVRNMQIGNTNITRLINGSGFCSPQSLSRVRTGFASLPSTPTRSRIGSGGDPFEEWDERIMERVESGKEIRAKIYAKLCRENSLAGKVDC